MPRIRQAILGATLLQPNRTWYLQQLARYLRVRPSSLQRELAALTAVGILKSDRQGRIVHYRADVNCPVYNELRGLMLKTSGLIGVLRTCLEPHLTQIECCFLQGSVGNSDESHSDMIELVIIGQITLDDLLMSLLGVQERLGREVNPRLYSPEQFADGSARRDAYLQVALAAQKFFVVGSQRTLDDLTACEFPPRPLYLVLDATTAVDPPRRLTESVHPRLLAAEAIESA
jgi:DNA-binding transcriptional ArsR family regulator